MRLVAKMNLDSAAIAAPQTIIKSATVFIVVPSDEYSIELRGDCQGLSCGNLFTIMLDILLYSC